MYALPEKFIENMKKQLPQTEWEAFFSTYENAPYKGVRLNTLKGGRDELKALMPFLEEQVEWEQNGFYTKEEKLGASPLHFAGLFYVQEPSAMSAAAKLAASKGEKVLDLCSAPGGKGTQLAAAMQGEGILVLNEPIFSRAKILSQNVERLGVKNALVISEMPEKLTGVFLGYFDKVLVDAPCSGEGMFRKNAKEALGEWSEENVALCAARQESILDSAVELLKVGGKMVYSTCTFAVDEDEGQMQRFVEKHPEMRLIESEKIYPHRQKGEGHFVALLEKVSLSPLQAQKTVRIKEEKRWVSQTAELAYRSFEKSVLTEKFAKNLHEISGTLYELPQGIPSWKGVQALRAGVRLGEVKNGRFIPDHALAVALFAEQCKNKVSFPLGSEAVEKYLRGETVESEGVQNGWCLVCVEGYPLGWAKAVDGVLKNHYPKGLRKMDRA